MNSDAPYESAVQTSLIPLHGRKWSPLFGIKFKKKTVFTLVWKHIFSS